MQGQFLSTHGQQILLLKAITSQHLRARHRRWWFHFPKMIGNLKAHPPNATPPKKYSPSKAPIKGQRWSIILLIKPWISFWGWVACWGGGVMSLDPYDKTNSQTWREETHQCVLPLVHCYPLVNELGNWNWTCWRYIFTIEHVDSPMPWVHIGSICSWVLRVYTSLLLVLMTIPNCW